MEVERDILIGFVEDEKSINGEKVKLKAVADKYLCLLFTTVSERLLQSLIMTGLLLQWL